ncbi:alpha/beta hydrolase, putative [Talaromyces stipitatus ATCC 10500]|uniref:Alpha/beta hydrolase, putative n=1 Tax=Talaromyces stipitatus (strain ATCC 10500 / CBS 375.48 / QM 6759 / NRRL 1006) TaxID=441959 RepID=B8LY90_TALSN|nr:alpha/beta hydrolase, putative [Talaromyces stipitatus ATCC 10500]EED23335.1 alpha/beta hydrolase, putative [Talaromyces stipitatus ATCC 10500]
MPHETINTVFGQLHAVVQGNLDSDKTLLLLHGNSSTWKAFTPILDDEVLKSTYKLIAFDLPGHGDSGDAPNPQLSYNIPAYAKAALEVLRHFQVKSYVAYGSSMGGQIAWDMIKIAEDFDVRGVMTSGSSPFGSVEEIQEGFKFNSDDNVATTGSYTDEQVEWAVKNAYGGVPQPFIARPLMFENIVKGESTDQRKIVKETKVPIAIVNGETDPFINLDVFDRLEFGNLWKGKQITILGSGHCPYWDNPDEFLPILVEFAANCYAA